MHGPPVDLSFKGLQSMKDALAEEPNPGVRKLRRDAEKKFCSRALRLNNNNLTDLDGFITTVNTFVSNPYQLAWVDLSFNSISRIDTALTELRDLRVLYLHGNTISKLSEVEKLAVLPFLHTLTLHGNSIENKRGYRGRVIAALPHLKTLDFSTVTKEERTMSRIWHKSKTPKSNKTCPR
ncbi:leucine-rich repeat-containing protein 51-like [Scleropages formosus]|uniref:Leucine-rich repeat-containing protein 51 n=1 Tax=Scleropages formosus TaxID=113540 RepID=A0A0P7Z061_SCLFO|nr:leucine-rich repeat-containing protein 51-like [Scleropages formosus]KPP73676.1 leucine-rich repeat-containing protein 51-like [Scleropages formosus]